MNHFEKLKEAVKNSELDAILLLSQPNRFYASGFNSSDGAAVITEDKAYFFTDSRYIEAAENGIKDADVLPVDRKFSYTKRINDVLSSHNVKKLGFEEESVYYSEFKDLEEKLCASLVPAQNTVSRLRASKDENELQIMIKAQRIAEKAFEEILPIISTDITEKDLAAELLYRMMKNGAEDKSFDTIAISGEKTSMPHGVPENRKLKKGFLTIDFGALYCGYCSDTTRTLCIGKPSDEMKKVYDIVLEAQKQGIAAAKAGALGKDIDLAGRSVIEKAGYGDYFGHAFGHSLGIEIHEAPNASPNSAIPMPCGAVISAEPGIYIPGKFGVRIEDVLYIEEDGCRNITNISKELIIL